MTAVTLKNIAKTFAGSIRALLPSDLAIEDGEIVSLLGPSGCGKTTLLRIIAGLERSDPGGEVRFGDDDVTDLSVEKCKVGMVFQYYALFPNMSVCGNIGYGLKMQGLTKFEREARVDEVIALCRLEEHTGKAVNALSGDQR
ncbi:ABC transporter ATP-binding protein [Breoghania sp.]|uniref:ABC transporter ATP-binding protein n=1 Tax=Breoghania sp. TaxID=2065378 RepID=UPI00261C007A|nr:ABC transporter ATP-binding protein [Breoghania sp.]MDJ0932780.1 ABC transporter ATP-binding protein [Breoghania sp.]